jgi:proline dehydrogenase
MRRTSFVLANKVPFGKDSTIFQRLSIPELLRTMFVFRLCSINYLVERSPQLLDLSSRLIGAHMTYDVLARHTFYVQFCAGRDEEEIKPALKALQDQGIGPILDYAAEAPVDATEEAKKSTASVLEVNLRKLLHASDIVYASDSPLDANVALFISSIESAAATMNPGGVAFAAVKVTGLCDCQLLARISAIMLRIRQTWAEYYIPENEGVAPNLENCREVCSRSRAPAAAPRRCPHDAFREGLLRMAPTLTEPEVEQILAYFDKDGKGYVHYFDYTHLLRTAIMNADETPAVSSRSCASFRGSRRRRASCTRRSSAARKRSSRAPRSSRCASWWTRSRRTTRWPLTRSSASCSASTTPSSRPSTTRTRGTSSTRTAAW